MQVHIRGLPVACTRRLMGWNARDEGGRRFGKIVCHQSGDPTSMGDEGVDSVAAEDQVCGWHSGTIAFGSHAHSAHHDPRRISAFGRRKFFSKSDLRAGLQIISLYAG